MTPQSAAALRALVSEISKTAFHQREQGMREMPDLLESYASRLDAVLTQEGADVPPKDDFRIYVTEDGMRLPIYGPRGDWNAPAEPRAAEGAGTGNWTEDSTHEKG